MGRVGAGRGRAGAARKAEADLGGLRPFSPWAYLLITLWAVVLALVSDGWRLAALAGLELVFGLAWNRRGLAPLRRLRFWILIVSAVALGPLLSPKTGSMEGVVMDRAGLWAGLEMAARALTVSLAFSLGLSALSLSDLISLFDRLHLRGLGFAVGVAMNLLSTLREMASTTLETIRLRGGLRRPFLASRLFLVTLVSNVLRQGDQIVRAAAVRGFEPGDNCSPLPDGGVDRQGADIGLVVALVGCGTLLLMLG